MADVWVVLGVPVFFSACLALVWGCDRIIGPDEHELLDDNSADVPAPVVTR